MNYKEFNFAPPALSKFNFEIIEQGRLFFNNQMIKGFDNTLIRKLSFQLLLLFVTLNTINSQTINIKSDCANFNQFINSEYIDSLQSLTDTIYDDGSIYFDQSILELNGELDVIYPLLGLNQFMSFEQVYENSS